MPAKKKNQLRNRQKKQKFSLKINVTKIKQYSSFVVIILLGFSIRAGIDWLQKPEVLPITKVTVDGELNFINREDLAQFVASKIDGGFFSQDLHSIRHDVEQLSWVYKASLRRAWPDRLQLQVVEQKPIAVWNNEFLLNSYGERFNVSNIDAMSGLIQISGSNGRELVLLKKYIAAEKVLFDIGLTLDSLEESARGDQRLYLVGGLELALGRTEQDERLNRFANVYKENLEQVKDRIASLDLRYGNGFSVRWKTESEEQSS